jgi:hypothetical protein
VESDGRAAPTSSVEKWPRCPVLAAGVPPLDTTSCDPVGGVVDEVAGAEATVVEGAADEEVDFPVPPQPPARMATAARTLPIAAFFTLASFLAKV